MHTIVDYKNICVFHKKNSLQIIVFQNLLSLPFVSSYISAKSIFPQGPADGVQLQFGFKLNNMHDSIYNPA